MEAPANRSYVSSYQLMSLPYPEEGTATRLMDAAERLFAERGVEATSVRQLAQAAHANIAAVHYHFGGKDGLLEQVLLRRMGQIAGQRAAFLQAGIIDPEESAIEAWVRMLVTPLTDLIQHEGEQGRAYVRLMWRCHSERPEWAESLSLQHFGKEMRSFNRWLRDALNGLPADEIGLRARFATRLTFDILAGNLTANNLSVQLQQFLCAGLNAHR